MDFNLTIKKIRIFSIISFLLPLITINVCLLLYKTLGNINPYAPVEIGTDKIKYEYNEYASKLYDEENIRFTNCSKYKILHKYITIDNKTLISSPYFSANQLKVIEEKRIKLRDEKKIKYVILEKTDLIDKDCIKNYKFLDFILSNFPTVEKLLLKAKNENSSGFSKIKNPYLYGEVSISRTARYFPATYIFKPFVIISALFLFLYWRNNLNLFNKFQNNKKIRNFSKKFYYYGLLSCLFLILHASFLGLDIDDKIFQRVRKLVIILFIVFEVAAQISLTLNLYKFKEEIKINIRSIILKFKLIFVLFVFLGTCISFYILGFQDPSSSFKQILEWNYFSILLLYYLLSASLWKNELMR